MWYFKTSIIHNSGGCFQKGNGPQVVSIHEIKHIINESDLYAMQDTPCDTEKVGRIIRCNQVENEKRGFEENLRWKLQCNRQI